MVTKGGTAYARLGRDAILVAPASLLRQAAL